MAGMNNKSLSGHQVTLTSARGHIQRTVVADLGDVLVVGTPEEHLRAQSAGIDRFAVGFRRSDVIEADYDTVDPDGVLGVVLHARSRVGRRG